MGQRTSLQALLEGITPNVYFQPPSNTTIAYPCIVYERSGADKHYADSASYVTQWRYQVTVIDRNPDSTIPGKVLALPLCSYDRHYDAAGLNHDVFNLYY